MTYKPNGTTPIGPRTYRAVSTAPEDDREAVLLACQVHAEEVCAAVWPGGTVDPDAHLWEWNDRFRSTAGRFHPNYGEPKIELAWGSFERHGWFELLDTVRHELVHAWQYHHPDGGRLGHGPKFYQWVDDLSTSRHCRNW